ncbi:MAG: 4-hydroxyphenylacetate decarboxylase activating enzyme [Peptostreptococcus russellii]
MNLQGFSVNDGNGIHTNIFLAGCPLKCQWCANPESHSSVNRISYNKKSCINCGKCTEICPINLDIDLSLSENRDRCNECGKCVEVCPNHSRKKLINKIELEKIIQEVIKHEIFYRYSNGGVTFTGGEPFSQIEVLDSLSSDLYDMGINLTIETSAFWDFESVKEILKKMCLIFVDIKHMDEEKHIKYTSVSNKLILKNIENISKLNIDTVVRIPLIKGVNSDEENIIKTAKFVKNNFKNPKIEILPYHRYGEVKYDTLALKKPSDTFSTPSDSEINSIKKLIELEGVKIVNYR